MDFAFPQMVWLYFYKSKFSSDTYSSKLVRNTKTARKAIVSAREERNSYVEVYTYDNTKIYAGALDEEKIISELRNYYSDDLFPMFRANEYVGTEEFSNEVVRFLNFAKDSLKQDDEYTRMKTEKDIEKINKCIEAIKTIKPV